MSYCFIIYSEHLNRFYTGICQNNIAERIGKHNDHAYGNHRFTAKASDWKLFLSIECLNMSHARRVELHIKKMKSSNYIKNLKSYPDLVKKLKTRFKNPT